VLEANLFEGGFMYTGSLRKQYSNTYQLIISQKNMADLLENPNKAKLAEILFAYRQSPVPTTENKPDDPRRGLLYRITQKLKADCTRN